METEPFELLVMRHAKSDWSTHHSDFDRPLNRRGSRASEQMARWIVDQALEPDRVLSSPAVRARTTALAVAGACDLDPATVEFDDELYLADAWTWLTKLQTQDCDRLLICGHNPGLDQLVDHLSGGSAPFTDTGKLMTTAAVAHFAHGPTWSALGTADGHCELLSLTRPGDL
ncbi:MAG: SixA phosphatase family protein [Acidimicrobiales bacterium]